MDNRIPAWRDGRLVPVDKLEVHRLGLRHLAVSVFVTIGDEVLIQRRAAGKYHSPGLWANTCCTHPRWGESDADCSVRRLNEELGITGLYPTFRDKVEYRAEVGGGMVEHELVSIFVAEAEKGIPVSPNPDEVSEVRWVNRFDLAAEVARRPDAFTPWLRIYLGTYSKQIFIGHRA